MDHDVLIVGSGHGGAQCAIALRQRGFTGSVAIVSADPELPYERPPLSKDYLAGARPFERMLIRAPAYWEEHRITLLPGREVVRVDATRRRVALADGASIGFGKLVWAAGGRALRLACPGADLGGIHNVRSRAEADRIIAELPRVQRAVVVGGGYIGLETAAILAGLGKEVLLVETQDRVLSRVAGAPVSHYFEAAHRARGVDLRLSSKVERFEGKDGRLASVVLAGGERVAAELAVVGIGIVAEVAPLADAGAVHGDGVHVDAHCETSLPGIHAVGDCAAHCSDFAGGARIRLESVQNAVDQAGVAAGAIVGAGAPYDALPWFWSNQFDIRLQTVGLQHGHDEIVVRGDPDRGSFSTVYLKQGRVIALDCVNAVRDYAQGHRLIAAGVAPPRDLLADPDTSLKSFLPVVTDG